MLKAHYFVLPCHYFFPFLDMTTSSWIERIQPMEFFIEIPVFYKELCRLEALQAFSLPCWHAQCRDPSSDHIFCVMFIRHHHLPNLFLEELCSPPVSSSFDSQDLPHLLLYFSLSLAWGKILEKYTSHYFLQLTVLAITIIIPQHL